MEKGYMSVDRLLQLANSALGSVKLNVWVLMDRLDVAFAETHELERNALRALFSCVFRYGWARLDKA